MADNRTAHKRRNRRIRRTVLTLVLTAIVVLGLVGIGRYAWHRVQLFLYPMKYTEQVTAASEQYDLTPSLIYAVIQTESHFDAEAQSYAGALGLMQMTPDTFTWLQTYTDDAEMTAERLTDPDISIRYGTLFLRMLIDEFGGVETALAGYNAGMGRVQSWLEDPAYSADGVTLDVIPYKETEDYVSKVLKAQKIYQELYAID